MSLPSPPIAGVERPGSGNPVLAPARLLSLYHIPGACGAQGPVPRSRGARRDRRTRAALLHLHRRSLALALAPRQHPARGRPPRSAHAPLLHWSRGWRHQAHIRPYIVRAYLMSLFIVLITDSNLLAPYSFGPPPSLTATCRTSPYRRVTNQSCASASRGRCAILRRHSRRPCTKNASRLSVLRKHGINGRAGDGSRESPDSGRPDYEMSPS